MFNCSIVGFFSLACVAVRRRDVQGFESEEESRHGPREKEIQQDDNPTAQVRSSRFHVSTYFFSFHLCRLNIYTIYVYIYILYVDNFFFYFYSSRTDKIWSLLLFE